MKIPAINSATIIPPARHEVAEKDYQRWLLSSLLLGYLIIWAMTGAHFMADTTVYAQAILEYHHGTDSHAHLLTSNSFWDFGHLLWRPLGWICFVLLRPVTQILAHENERAQVTSTLIGIDFVTALACVYFFFTLARRVVESDWPAAVATFAFFSTDAFLNYAHSGSAYVAGLGCLLAGMRFSLVEPKTSSLIFDLLAGLMFALSVLFWFPYMFVLPGALATPLVIHGHDRFRWTRVGRTITVCAIVGLGAYVLTVLASGIGNVSALKEWILSSGHGQIQAGGVRSLARLALSVPRSFINMARDGMWLKRYLLHDPYAPTSIPDLLRLSLWKLVLFYISTGIVCLELLRSKPGRKVLLLLGSTVLPMFVFAVFIFEAGSIERYLPLYPFVFLALCYVLGLEQMNVFLKCFLVLALMIVAGVNIESMRRSTLQEMAGQGTTRLHDLVPLLTPNSVVAAVNEQDSLAEFRQNFPLDEINLQARWRTYDMLEINAARLATWRQDFATLVVDTWKHGGAVWLPERVFATRPKPEWNWVEGDDKRIKWTDLPDFFSQFDTGPVVGGEDGFVLLQQDSKNEDALDQCSRR